MLEFLRDVGKHVTVNQMIARESVRKRIESEHGISFTEFTYMLLQANDYLWLHDHLGCEVQIGGSDQWGNIIAGVDLIRRKRQTAVHAFAWPLLTAADGSKLGKTTGARTWLDPAKTTPYQFRQHWLQIGDDEIRVQLLTFSLRPVEELEALLDEHAAAPHERSAQRALAREMTELVHGADAARAADEAADVLFGADPTSASEAALDAVAREVPSSRRAPGDLDDLVELLVATEMASSKGDAPANARRARIPRQRRADRPLFGARRDRAPAWSLPAPPARQEVTSSRRGFPPDQGCRAPGQRAKVYIRLADRSLVRRKLAPSPSVGRATSYGSLKTEEKTERQCGQFVEPTLGSV